MPWASITDALRARVGRRLERGGRGSAIERAASAGWGAIAGARLARPLAIPEGLAAIGVGSAVLGGAGKTPIAIALARELARGGERVVLVSHAYRAAPGRPRLVAPDDPVREVGDDALASARRLEGAGVSVVVAPTRAAALELARARGAEIAVLDGLLQAAPRRLAAAVLVLDGGALWGAGACPPAGDLRAPRAALLAAADVVAVVRAHDGPAAGALHRGALEVASSVLEARDAAGARVPLETLSGARVGVLLAIGRPERVLCELGRQGIAIQARLLLGDHARIGGEELAAMRDARVDVWLTTERCATKLPSVAGRAPVLVLQHEVDVRALARCVRERIRHARRPSRPAETLC